MALQKVLRKLNITPFSYLSIIIQFLLYFVISLSTVYLLLLPSNIYLVILSILVLSYILSDTTSLIPAILVYLVTAFLTFLINIYFPTYSSLTYILLPTLALLYTIFIFPKNISNYHTFVNLILFGLLGLWIGNYILPVSLSPLNLNYFSFLLFHSVVLTLLIVITSGVSDLYAESFSIQMEKIKIIEDKLKNMNRSLKLEVIKKTKELISSKTKLVKSQKYLEQAYKSLDSAEQDRFTKMNLLSHYSVMLSSVIHDVNNPLMYVMNTLRDKKIDNKNELMDSLEAVTTQLNEVRAHLKIDSEQKSFNVFEIVKTTLKILDWKFKKYDVNLKLDLDTDIELSHGSSQFKDIVLNLLDNAVDAVKDIDNPEITIKTEKKKDFGILSITDNGIGISKKDAKNIFNIFYSTKEQGNGIGLYISHKYAKEEFSGNIAFTSTKKKTVFIFKFLIR